MDQKYHYEGRCARYVLGELSEQEQALFEEAYFSDDLLFDRLLAVKDDLIDAYARGDLTEDMRERFERHFLANDDHRQQVIDARDLIRAASAASLNQASVNVMPATATQDSNLTHFSFSRYFALHPFALKSALTALLIVALGGSWALVRYLQRQREVQNQEAARKQQEGKPGALPVNENRAELMSSNPTNLATNASANSNHGPGSEHAMQSRPTKQDSSNPLPAQIASLTLLPFAARDSNGSNSLSLSANIRAARLRLIFKDDNYRRYNVALATLGGGLVLRRRGLKVSSSDGSKSVTLTVDPAVLRHQDYIATLSGITVDGKFETIGDYYFRVDRSTSHTTPRPPQ